MLKQIMKQQYKLVLNKVIYSWYINSLLYYSLYLIISLSLLSVPALSSQVSSAEQALLEANAFGGVVDNARDASQQPKLNASTYHHPEPQHQKYDNPHAGSHHNPRSLHQPGKEYKHREKY